jgi:hypothetical protein
MNTALLFLPLATIAAGVIVILALARRQDRFEP